MSPAELQKLLDRCAAYRQHLYAAAAGYVASGISVQRSAEHYQENPPAAAFIESDRSTLWTGEASGGVN